MKKIKSIAALSLAVLMMAGMAGCGNTAVSYTQSPSPRDRTRSRMPSSA